jgi:tetratricopeptide (TPR) repeat protein
VKPPRRRIDPCPCGSGLRYKECHGKLDAEGPPTAQRIQRALQLHRQGHLGDAERIYQDVLREDPGNAVAAHYLGMIAWARGDRVEAERLLRAAISRDPATPDFHNNLGRLLHDTRRLDEAMAAYRAAIAIEPRWMDVYGNLGLALEAAGRNDEAIAVYGDALARDARFAIGHRNLALALLAAGRVREALPHYRWRLRAEELTAALPDPAATPWPEGLQGRRVALRTERGLGEALFFLRFAPEAVRRGAQLAFRGDVRLHPMLTRTGLFALGLEGEATAAGGMEEAYVGDLPWLLGIDEPARFPRALPLMPDSARVRDWRVKLAALGTGPYIALTWRAGTASTSGPVRTPMKEIAPATLGQRLRGTRATWISVQRLPGVGERESLAAALGSTVHDAAFANGDLEEMLALISVVDDYIGVSNTNTHLRAGTGGPMKVLVPHPPEWRWGLEGDRSPWFPTAIVERQKINGRWD